MVAAIELIETDYGTKQKTRQAIRRIVTDKPREFHKLLREYLEQVVADAKAGCPVDTGALKRSIRLVSRETMPRGSFVAGRDVTENFMVIAGGPPFINPKTKRFIDYAQAVHDGTLKQPPRPFLTDSVAKNKPLLDRITDQYIKYIEHEWSRD